MRSGFARPRMSSIRAIECDFDESRPPYRTFHRLGGTSVSTAFLGRSIASCIHRSDDDLIERLDRPTLAIAIDAHGLSRFAVHAIAKLLQGGKITRSNQVEQLCGKLI